MARLISAATGNFTTAASWQVADTTSLLDAEAANTVLTTAYVASATFTPGAITIDGISVKLASRAASPSGTISVALDQGGSDVVGTAVTINVADLPACSTAQNEGGWVFFKFAAPVLLVAATAYSVKAKTSVAAMVNLYRNATAANWSRLLRTTTTGAPAAGDILLGIGEKTGAGTGNTFTHTFDSVANITLGTSCDTAAPLLIITGAYSVGNGYTLNGGNAAATAYLLKMAGCLIAYSGATVNLWRTSTLPTDSTGTISFTPVASGDFGIVCRNGSTVSIGPVADPQGRTARGALLVADAAISATALTLDASYAWRDTDPVVIGSTASWPNSTADQSELRALSGNESGAGITLSAGLTYAHLGDPTGSYTDPDIGVTYAVPRQAEVLNLSGQITINSTSSTIGYFIFASNTATVIIEWALLRYLGSALTGRRGVEVDTTTGSFTLRNVALRDSVASTIWLGSASAAWDNVTVTKMVGYNLSTALAADVITVAASTGTGWVVDDWMLAKTVLNGATTVLFKGLGGTVFKTKPLRITAHQGYNYPLFFNAPHNINAAPGSFHVHSSNAFASVYLADVYRGTIVFDLIYSWRNSAGISFGNSAFRVLEARSYGDYQFCFGAGSNAKFDVDKLILAADAVQSSSHGLWFDDFAFVGRIRNAVISPNSGNLKPLQTAITPMFAATVTALVTFERASIARGGGTFLGTVNGYLAGDSYVAFEGLAGTYDQYTLLANGTIGRDAVITRNGDATLRITPTGVSANLFHAPTGKGILVPTKRTGGTLVSQSGTIDLRTSVVGDGAAYNGSAPQVWLRANPALGIAADTLLATMSGSAGAWNSTAFTLPVPTADGAYEIVIMAASAASPAGWVNAAVLAAS